MRKGVPGKRILKDLYPRAVIGAGKCAASLNKGRTFFFWSYIFILTYLDKGIKLGAWTNRGCIRQRKRPSGLVFARKQFIGGTKRAG